MSFSQDSTDSPSSEDAEALFYFAGGGLSVTGAALGSKVSFDRDGVRGSLRLPDLSEISDEGRWGSSARKTRWQGDTGEIRAATIEAFEVRIEVSGDSNDPLAERVKQAAPHARAAADALFAAARVAGEQTRLPRVHEGARMKGYRTLVRRGTNEEIDPEGRWHPVVIVTTDGLDSAANEGTVREWFSAVATGHSPSVADAVLADARAVVSPASVSNELNAQDLDTAHAVVLAAVACEVKIKETMVDKAPAHHRDLLQIILENPRDVSIAAAQLVDKPMKAALGVSLREDDREPFKAVSSDLFPRRNAVAHRAYQPTLDEARQSVDIATRLFAWLNGLKSQASSSEPT